MKFDRKKWEGYGEFCIGATIGSSLLFLINPNLLGGRIIVLSAVAGIICYARLLWNLGK